MTKEPVTLAAGGKATADVCLYPAPRPFAKIKKLGKGWLVLEVPGEGSSASRRRLVGYRAVDDAEDSTTVWVTPALFETVAPDAKAGAMVAGTVHAASKREIFSLQGFAAIGKVVSATLAFAALVAGAIASFATSETGLGIIALVLAILVGLIGWRAAIQAPYTPPNCGPGT